MAGPVQLGEDAKKGVRAALDRVCEQPQFVNSPALVEMLRYIVESTMAGGGENLKGYTIATEALGRPSNFDPQADPIVRVTATRLRRALESYAQGAGTGDPVSIVLERGSYAPKFLWRDATPEVAATEVAPPAELVAIPEPSTRAWRSAAVAVALFAAALVFYIFVSIAPWREPAPSTRAVATPGDPFSLGAALPVPEARPTLIVGKLSLSNADPELQTIARQLRARLVSALRPFDDILNVRDDPDYSREAHTGAAAPMTYLIEGDVGARANHVIMTSNIKDLATGVTIYTSLYDERRDSDPDFSRIAALFDSYAVHIAQPYGIISSNVWRRLRNTPEQQGTYICQLRVFNYWQVYIREAFDQALGCLRKRLADEPDSAAILSNLTFLYVEAIRAGYQLDDPELATHKQILDRVLRTANKAVQAEPDSARTHSAMAAAYMINRNIRAAIDAARQAIKLNPRDPELLADLGAKLVQFGSYKEAADLLNPVLATGGAQPPWRHVFAALAHYMLGESEGLIKQAGLLKKEEGLLVTIMQLLGAIAAKDQTAILASKGALATIAPDGHAHIMSALGDRIYNLEILNRISKDLALVLSN